jgi:hypothetical protein
MKKLTAILVQQSANPIEFVEASLETTLLLERVQKLPSSNNCTPCRSSDQSIC